MMRKESLSSGIKLNLGAGPNGIDGWLNFDWGMLAFLSKFKYLRRFLVELGILENVYVRPWPKTRLVDIRQRLPLANNSVKYIYCSHVLEHFERWQALNILRECQRVLKPTGVIRIIGPDLEKMIRIYHDSNKKGENGADLFFHYVWGYHKEKSPRSWFEEVVKRKFIRDHKWNYDTASMKVLLNEAGFTQIAVLGIRSGQVPDLALLDYAPHEHVSLYLEAEK